MRYALAKFITGGNKNGHVSWGPSEPRLDIVARCRRVLLGEETSSTEGQIQRAHLSALDPRNSTHRHHPFTTSYV